MKAMRNLLVVIAAITVGGFAACNETVGECWYYGEGTENAGAGPGGGVLIPTGPAGVGGYGEGPPKQPQDAPDRPPPVCNEDEEPEFGKPADQYIDCRKRGLSAEACSEICNAAGAICYPFVFHPYKKNLPDPGGLIWCKNGSPSYVCQYNFSNGDSCARVKSFLGFHWLCAYPGEK